MKRSQRHRGFTLLEVMVAVAILGLGLTAILSAQAGAYASAKHARNVSVATGLARCKMMEVEEYLLRFGFQDTDLTDSGPCCDTDDTPNMKCTWKIEAPTMPISQLGDLDLDTKIDPDSLGAIGQLLQPGAAKDVFSDSSKLSDVAQQLAGTNAVVPGQNPQGVSDLMAGGAAAGGMGTIASMVMTMVYPDLKNLFEGSTRRVTIDLVWKEGQKNYTLQLEQWIVQPQPGLPTDDDTPDDALTDPSKKRRGDEKGGRDGKDSKDSHEHEKHEAPPPNVLPHHHK